MNRKQLDEVDSFKNRITGSGLVRAAELIENPLNARRHSKEQAAVMHGALNELGWIQEVIVNQRTGRLIDGHLRLSLALRQGNDTPVPVKYVDLDENEERLALLTLDPISAMAETDNAALEALLQDVNTGEAALQEFLADLVAIDEQERIDRTLEEIDAAVLPVRPVWCLLTIDMEEIQQVKPFLDSLAQMAGVRVELSTS